MAHLVRSSVRSSMEQWRPRRKADLLSPQLGELRQMLLNAGRGSLSFPGPGWGDLEKSCAYPLGPPGPLEVACGGAGAIHLNTSLPSPGKASSASCFLSWNFHSEFCGNAGTGRKHSIFRVSPRRVMHEVIRQPPLPGEKCQIPVEAIEGISLAEGGVMTESRSFAPKRPWIDISGGKRPHPARWLFPEACYRFLSEAGAWLDSLESL